MAITAEPLNQFLAAQGVTLDPLMVDAIVELANNADLHACFEANGYTAAAQTVLCLYLAYLIALGSFSRFITSQSAPNGASRSFNQASLSDMWKGALSAIGPFDPAGCLADFLPQDPTVTKRFGSRVGVACYNRS